LIEWLKGLFRSKADEAKEVYDRIVFLKMVRVVESGTATISVLRQGETHVCFCLEPPWRGNERNVSCIPEGYYWCETEKHRKFGLTFLITGVPDRDGIYVHVGNFLSETRGCPLPGLQAKEDKVFHSSSAMERIRSLIEGKDGFLLKVCSIDS